MGEAHLAARYNRPGHEIFQHRTFVLASDGDVMEGVGAEAASLAGHLRLGRLIVLYDNNHVTLSGTTPITFTEDVAARYRAYGWHVDHVSDGNDVGAIERALRGAIEDDDRPSLIIVDTVIGYGAPNKSGTFEVHGSPLGADETARTKENLGWPAKPAFFVPPYATAHLHDMIARARFTAANWRKELAAYAREYPDLAARAHAPVRGAAARSLVERPAGVPSRRQGDGDAQGLRSDPAGAGAQRARAGGRFGRSGSVDVHLAEEGRRLRARGRAGERRAGCRGRRLELRGTQHPLRRARARDGWRGERPRLPRRLHPVRRDVPGVLGLHASRDPARGARAPAVDLRLHTRQHRPGRGRAEPPGGRAAGGAARDSGAAGDPPRRRQRDARRLAGRDRDARSADGAGADAPGGPDAGSRPLRRPRGPAPRRLRPRT